MRVLLLAVAITACGGKDHHPPTEHLTRAVAHGTTASRNSAHASSPYYWNQPYTPGHGWYPWYYYWDPTSEHERLAATKGVAIDAVKLEHRAACATIPLISQSSSPFDIHALDSTRTRDGVILHLAPEAGPPDMLLVLMRCHRAWLRLARPGDAADIMALDGPKLVVYAGGRTSIEVMFSTTDPNMLNELERRAKLIVMRAKQRRPEKREP